MIGFGQGQITLVLRKGTSLLAQAAIVCLALNQSSDASELCSRQGSWAAHLCQKSTPEDILREIMTLSQEILKYGDLHDIGFLETKTGLTLHSTNIYGDFRDRHLYFNGGKEIDDGPHGFDNEASRQKILQEVWFEAQDDLTNTLGLSFRLIIYVLPRITGELIYEDTHVRYWQAELQVTINSSEACPAHDFIEALLHRKAEQFSAPLPPPPTKQGLAGSIPVLSRYDFNLSKTPPLLANLIYEGEQLNVKSDDTYKLHCHYTLSVQQPFFP